MKQVFLDFEKPIAELEEKIEQLRCVHDDSAVNLSEEIDRLIKKNRRLISDTYSSLRPWQIVQVSRHVYRPYTLDYIQHIFTDFVEIDILQHKLYW